MSKICVTGAAGFIGSHLCERLLKDGHEVVGMDNFSAGKLENVFHLFDGYPKFRVVTLDTRYDKPVDDFFNREGFDVVFHEAASKKNICLKDPRIDCDVNARGTLNLLMAAKKYGVEKFIHASTGSVYGHLLESPQTENHPLRPCSYYGVSKMAGERYVEMFNLNTVIFRYFHVYGPRQECDPLLGGVVAIWAHNIWRGIPITIHGDGTQQRSFTFVGDVVEANIRAMNGTTGLGDVYNCASGIKINLLELLAVMEDKIGRKAIVEYGDILEGDIHIFDISNQKIKDRYKMNFKSLEDGLDETLGYYKPTD